MTAIAIDRKITPIVLFILIALYLSCSEAPIESEALSSDAYTGTSSLRVVTFGILSPGDTLQKIMVENSRNNVVDFYYGQKHMVVSGSLADVGKTYPLNIVAVPVNDPYQMPDLFGVFEIIDLEIEEIKDILDPSWQALSERQLAITLGLIRMIIWLTTESVIINGGDTYWLNLKMTDSRYPNIETIIRDSTTVPGSFDITYPAEGAAVASVSNQQLRWTPSKQAAGYRIIATTPASKYKKFETIVGNMETTFDIPLFFEEKGPYEIQIWALDANYFRFLSQRLEGQRVNRTHFFDYGEMNLSALVVFGSRVMRSVAFTVE